FSNDKQAPRIKIKSKIDKGIKLNNEKLAKETLYCHISVSDNGIGFEQQYSEKIFGVFQRLHRKNEYNGTGIGLAIVKKIVENHNGIITAKGELNKGATFDIYFPAGEKQSLSETI
ncbi:MAG TPA: ATP-binding protein, partial [Bacteroidia bacterium]|nr:ATP-binding protein [Bacteroidia bacterium]